MKDGSPHIPALIVDQVKSLAVLIVDLDDFGRIGLLRVLPLAVSDFDFGTETKFILG